MSSDNNEGATLKRRSVLKAMGTASALTTLPSTGTSTTRGSSAAQVGEYRIEVLSSKPDQVSGGDALIEIVLPSDTTIDDVTVLRNGTDVTEQFSSHPDRDSITGLLAGFEEGENTVALEDDGELVLEEEVVNHPIHGPMFSGPQQDSFACNTEDGYLDALDSLGQPQVDNQDEIGVPVYAEENGQKTDEVVGYSQYCQVDPRVDYVYVDTDRNLNQIGVDEPLPDDVATTTLDGEEVPMLVRIEVGVINRWLYTISVLADPEELSGDLENPETSRWNEKLLMRFQGGTGIGHTQGSASDYAVFTEPALRMGYAVAYSVGVKAGESYNLEVGGETALMLKERFIERFGEPRFTFSTGDSGGAVQSYVYAQNYPDLLDGIAPEASYPDMVTQTIHIGDCGPLEFYMDVKDVDNDKWFDDWNNRESLLGLNATNDIDHQFNDEFPVIGLPTERPREGTTECAHSWRGVAARVLNPHWGAHRIDGMRNFPDWEERFADVNLTHWDDAKNVYGLNDHGNARQPWDNVGVQYGLRALRDGDITKAEFLDVNTRVGGWQKTRNIDPPGEPYYTATEDDHPWIADPVEGDRSVWTDEPWTSDLIAWDEWGAQNQTHSPNHGTRPAQRTHGNLGAIRSAYEEGFVNVGDIDIPILDFRPYLEEVLDMHNTHQSFAARQRLINQNGHADNQIIWFLDREEVDIESRVFETMDAWLENLEANPELTPHEAKPDSAVDTCFDVDGNVIAAGEGVWDGVLDEDNCCGECAEEFEIYSQSRYQAGGPITGDVFKCQLQPVEEAIENGLYGDVEMSDEEIARLKRIFPDGVCDFDRPDAGQPHASGLPQGVWDSVAEGEEVITGEELAAAEAAYRAESALQRVAQPMSDEHWTTLQAWAEDHREGMVPPVPAAFTVAGLSPTDTSVAAGDTIEVSATIENVGDVSGTKTVELRVGQQTVASQERTLGAGDSDQVSFADVEPPASLDPGPYTLSIATPAKEASGTLTIEDSSPSGAFNIESIDPESATVGPGETVTLTADIRNTGGASDTVQVELRVGGIPFESQELTVAAGETATATFPDLEPASALDPGEYEPVIAIEGDEQPVTLTITDGDGNDDDDDDDDTGDGGEFSIESVDPESATVGPGDTLTLTADIANTGSSSGTAKIQLRVGGVPFETQERTIDAGETVTATFPDLEPASVLDPGEYEPVIWAEGDERPVSLTVTGDAGSDNDTTGSDNDTTGGDNDTADSDTDTNDTDDADGSGPGFGVGSAIATLGGLGYVLKRRLDDDDDSVE